MFKKKGGGGGANRLYRTDDLMNIDDAAYLVRALVNGDGKDELNILFERNFGGCKTSKE